MFWSRIRKKVIEAMISSERKVRLEYWRLTKGRKESCDPAPPVQVRRMK